MTLTDGPPIPVPTRDEYEAYLKRIEGMATAGQIDAGRSMVNFGSILYLTQERLGKAQPVSSQALSTEHPPGHKLSDPKITPVAGTVANPAPARLISLLAVAAASLCVSASPRQPEVRPVTASVVHPAASTSMLAGKAALLRGDYREALGHFQDAGNHGAVPEAYLPPMIECYLEIQQYGLALGLAVDLSNENPRNQSLVPFFRGQAYAGRGEKAKARGYFAEAKTLGHPLAAKALSKLEGP